MIMLLQVYPWDSAVTHPASSPSNVGVECRGWYKGAEARGEGCSHPKEDEGKGLAALCRLRQGSVLLSHQKQLGNNCIRSYPCLLSFLLFLLFSTWLLFSFLLSAPSCFFSSTLPPYPFSSPVQSLKSVFVAGQCPWCGPARNPTREWRNVSPNGKRTIQSTQCSAFSPSTVSFIPCLTFTWADLSVSSYHDPEFYEQCREEYLRERSEFRQTGVRKSTKRTD